MTVFTLASRLKAPVEVLESMINLSKLDAKKRNVLGIVNIYLCLPLHFTAKYHPDPAAIKLLVRHHPSVLLAKTAEGFIPLDHPIEFNNSPAVVSLVRDLTTARHATLTLRTTLILCIKHCYVYVRRSKRHRTETMELDVPRSKC